MAQYDIFKVRFERPVSKQELRDFGYDHDLEVASFTRTSATLNSLAGMQSEEEVRDCLRTHYPDQVIEVVGLTPTEYAEPEVSVDIEGLKVNLGAGGEKIPGWLGLDVPPERIPEFYEVEELEEEITPDITAELPNLPLEDESVAAFRMRDVLIYLNLPERRQLGREVHRCLKPGGVFVTLEHIGDERVFKPWLRVVSIESGGRAVYGSQLMRTVYRKE